MCNETLLREKIENNDKKFMGNKIIDRIIEAKGEYDKKVKIAQSTSVSITNIPFFDIEYRTVLRLITRTLTEEQELAIEDKKLSLFHQNMHIFERLFGFKFHDNKSLTTINNQSYIALENVFPEIKDIVSDEVTGLLQDDKETIPTSLSSFNYIKQKRPDNFQLLTQKSAIINSDQSLKVR